MRIGVDRGGTQIEGIAIADAGVVLMRERVPAPRGDYAATLAAVTGLVFEIERSIGGRGSVGIGIPGTISPATGLVKNANSTWLNGQPLADDLPRLLDRPIRFANDANCFALSEAVDGAAAGASPVFGVIIGTGTGGGLVIDGRVVTGANAIAGEWGHNPLPAMTDEERPGAECYCGRRGCIESFLSGPALSRDYLRLRSASFGETGSETSAQEIARRAAAGETLACAALDRYEARMARALASIVNVIDPEVIVLGGGLSNIDRLYQNVPTLWAPHIFSDRATTRLVRATHGDSSGVRGAAWLWE
jgi:fructokinase